MSCHLPDRIEGGRGAWASLLAATPKSGTSEMSGVQRQPAPSGLATYENVLKFPSTARWAST